MESMGPGRYRDVMAMRSSSFSGWKRIITDLSPEDSNWKTPSVSPFPSMAKVAGSSSGMVFTEKSGSFLLTSSSQSWMTVRVRSPKKSILRSPSSSSSVIVYWVTVVPSFTDRGT